MSRPIFGKLVKRVICCSICKRGYTDDEMTVIQSAAEPIKALYKKTDFIRDVRLLELIIDANIKVSADYFIDSVMWAIKEGNLPLLAMLNAYEDEIKNFQIYDMRRLTAEVFKCEFPAKYCWLFEDFSGDIFPAYNDTASIIRECLERNANVSAFYLYFLTFSELDHADRHDLGQQLMLLASRPDDRLLRKMVWGLLSVYYGIMYTSKEMSCYTKRKIFIPILFWLWHQDHVKHDDIVYFLFLSVHECRRCKDHFSDLISLVLQSGDVPLLEAYFTQYSERKIFLKHRLPGLKFSHFSLPKRIAQCAESIAIARGILSSQEIAFPWLWKKIFESSVSKLKL